MEHFTKDHCDPEKKDFMNQIIVLKEKIYDGYTLDQKDQLILVTHESLPTETNGEPPICGFRLSNHFTTGYNSNQIYGVLAEEYLPEWVKEKLDSLPKPDEIEHYEMFQQGKPMPFPSVDHARLLAEFNETFLIAEQNPSGRISFATCKLDEKKEPCGWWGYENFEEAKEGFATYSNLIPWQKMLSEEQRPVVSRACKMLMEVDQKLSATDFKIAKTLENWHGIQEKYHEMKDFEESDFWEDESETYDDEDKNER